MGKSHLFRPGSLCRRPIFTVGLELEEIGKKKRRSKNKVKWKHLTVFPEKNSHFVSPLETANGETLQNIIRQGKYEKPYFGTDCI